MTIPNQQWIIIARSLDLARDPARGLLGGRSETGSTAQRCLVSETGSHGEPPEALPRPCRHTLHRPNQTCGVPYIRDESFIARLSSDATMRRGLYSKYCECQDHFSDSADQCRL